MTRLRRTRYLAFSCQDESFIDVAALVRGVAQRADTRVMYALSILRGQEYPISDDELAFVLSVPTDRWISIDGLDATARRLAERGLILTDDNDPVLAELVRRDGELEEGQWNLYGALIHFLTKWRDVDLSGDLAEAAEADELPAAMSGAISDFVTRHGRAPAAFHALEGSRAVRELPLVERHDGLYEALAQRKTTRRFDRGARITIDELATVLHYVFGCHGLAGMARGGLMLKRTSPSGGGLHPIEAYPLIAGVDGLAPGLYHYNARDHSLELIAELDAQAAADTADTFSAGSATFLPLRF
jgi:hypothetical protein